VEYRQGKLFGSWVLLDVSTGGLCACGDLAGFEVGDQLQVNLRNGRTVLLMTMQLTWKRYDSTGVSVHGWEFLDEVADLPGFMASLTRQYGVMVSK